MSKVLLGRLNTGLEVMQQDIGNLFGRFLYRGIGRQAVLIQLVELGMAEKVGGARREMAGSRDRLGNQI